MKSPPDIAAPVRSVFDMPADMYEASLERLHHHTKNSSPLILSAFRSSDERTPEETVTKPALLTLAPYRGL